MRDSEKVVCKICLVPHDEEIHAATLSIHLWFREQVMLGLYQEAENAQTPDAAVA